MTKEDAIYNVLKRDYSWKAGMINVLEAEAEKMINNIKEDKIKTCHFCGRMEGKSFVSSHWNGCQYIAVP